MSRNYDNWERLVAAVVKREQIWQLCHQDSISTICASDYSSDLELGLPLSLGSFHIAATFELVQHLNYGKTDLVRLLRDVQVSDQQCFRSGSRAVIKLMDTASITEYEFEQHMIVLRDCKHENVGTPWAYHLSEERKLMVYDYYSQGSVFDMFRGNGSRPDWESRVRIAVGAARGIEHIHAQCGGKLVHGNIKSSNIFVNSQEYGCVSDICLGEMAHHYASKQELRKSDVYSFGMLLLELVIGRSLVHSPYIVRRLRLSDPDTLDFNGSCYFVDEVDMEDAKLDKFPFVDPNLDSSSVEQELRKMLKVAKICLGELPQHRPTMSQVVLQLEQPIITSDYSPPDYSPSHKSGDNTKTRVWNRIFRYPTYLFYQLPA
ncbi:probable inactive receptor kinase At5g53320 [Salvia miltiorrhiza]|uniref:probable inactive receptor kinase At5g53320 n=1 Tax=Salvia miltiorrhiza TaxID=226208 RepID=UPI0025ABA323|nr:probable inactive receptor kinase At5g53320 [Salvia miltiorrhiza]